MDNKTLGNSFEDRFCQTLFENGFWAHNLAQNSAGQPADVIAARNGFTYLIDCKVCSAKGFSLSRIEDNQELSMNLWNDTGNGQGWFALEVKNEVFMFTHYSLKWQKDKDKPKKFLSLKEIRERGIPLKDWLKTR